MPLAYLWYIMNSYSKRHVRPKIGERGEGNLQKIALLALATKSSAKTWKIFFWRQPMMTSSYLWQVQEQSISAIQDPTYCKPLWQIVEGHCQSHEKAQPH